MSNAQMTEFQKKFEYIKSTQGDQAANTFREKTFGTSDPLKEYEAKKRIDQKYDTKDRRGDTGKMFDDLSSVYGKDEAKEILKQQLAAKLKTKNSQLSEYQQAQVADKFLDAVQNGVDASSVAGVNAMADILGVPKFVPVEVEPADEGYGIGKARFGAKPAVIEYKQQAPGEKPAEKGIVEGKMADEPKKEEQPTTKQGFAKTLAQKINEVPPEDRAEFLAEAAKKYGESTVKQAVSLNAPKPENKATKKEEIVAKPEEKKSEKPAEESTGGDSPGIISKAIDSVVGFSQRNAKGGYNDKLEALKKQFPNMTEKALKLKLEEIETEQARRDQALMDKLPGTKIK
jgi:hypothetical protein